jgi:hypothetical protein
VEPIAVHASSWSARTRRRVLEAAHHTADGGHQCVALHLDSGYLRLVPDPSSSWGTSVVIVPSFWSRGRLHQGIRLRASRSVADDDLIVTVSGKRGGLAIEGEVRVRPPADGSIRAEVRIRTSGRPRLDDRHGEAFKPVMLSSMRVSEDHWDARHALAGADAVLIPDSGRLATARGPVDRFALVGGTSSHKRRAPTIEVLLDRPMPVNGWVTPTSDPDDDNIGIWAASDIVLTEWGYTLVARSTAP